MLEVGRCKSESLIGWEVCVCRRVGACLVWRKGAARRDDLIRGGMLCRKSAEGARWRAEWFRRTRTLAESGECQRKSCVRRTDMAGAMRQRERIVSSRQTLQM